MKTGTLTLLMIMIILTSSCNKTGKMFIASGYSAEGQDDVLLCSQGRKGNVSLVSMLSIGNDPSFFTFGKGGLIYFVNEVDTFDMKAGGGITTLRYDKKNRSLEKVGSINQGGGGPCHITLSDDGKHLITANYGSGSVSVIRLNSEGIPEKVTDNIFYGDRSHPHMTIYNPRLHTYYISDLGLDRICQLKLDTTTGLLINANVPYIMCEPGSGPRHMAIDKSSADLYVINELNSTLSVYNILSDTVDVKQTVSALPEGYTGKSYCADLHLSNNGKKIYGSNRGHNSIVTFRVGADGRLSQPEFRNCGGNWPRFFVITKSGHQIIVANEKSNEVTFIGNSSNSRKGNGKISIELFRSSCVQIID